MKHITFYLDFVAPYAYLSFEEMPSLLMGLSYCVHYKPIQPPPIHTHAAAPDALHNESAARTSMYQHAQSLAHSKAIAFEVPAMQLCDGTYFLRLALASDAQGLPNRYVCETVFRHLWASGGDPTDSQRLQHLQTQLPALHTDIHSAEVQAQLHAHKAQAQACGVVQVPSLEVDGKVFSGLDALPRLRNYLDAA